MGSVRRWLIAVLAVWVCLWPAAHAQYDPGKRGPWLQDGRDRRDARDSRSDRGRGREGSPSRQPDRERGGGSLTPDERRELNRDLQRANREFYRKGRDER